MQQCSFSFFTFYSPAAEWKRPVIKFNSKVVVGYEVVVSAGTPLVLSCEGDGLVSWHTRLPKHRRYVSRGAGRVRIFKVDRPSAEFTGTYQCAYVARNHMPRESTSTSVHVYVKGELSHSRCKWELLARRCGFYFGQIVSYLGCKCYSFSTDTLYILRKPHRMLRSLVTYDQCPSRDYL